MPGRYSGRRGYRRQMSVVSSIKNVVDFASGITSTNTNDVIALATNSPLSTTQNHVANGCIIKAIWVVIDVCGLGGTGVLNSFDGYLMKNPGANLTPPGAGNVGTSNEKKFVVKQWHAMIMRNQDGNNPYHWEGWVKIPKQYRRMGTDDTWNILINCTASVTGHKSIQCIYKWFR